MTKVIILGEQPKEEKKPKPIEFAKCLTIELDFSDNAVEPNRWPFIEVISRNYRYTGLTLFYAYSRSLQ